MINQQRTRLAAAALAVIALATGCVDQSTGRTVPAVECDASVAVCVKYQRCLQRQPAHLLFLCDTLVGR